MENPEVAQIFDEVAELLEIQDANPFRVRAYRNAARTIRDLSEPVEQYESVRGRKLSDLPGIGDDLAAKIHTILETGDLPLRRELGGRIPSGLRDLLAVPSVGPKRARLLFDTLHIQSLAELQDACRCHRICKIKGFGEKSEQNILHSLEGLGQIARRMHLCEAAVYAEALVKHLRSAPRIRQIAVAGSYRRCQETVGDLDILVACTSAPAVMNMLASYSGVVEILARGPTKMSVRLSVGLQVDLRIVPEASYGAALQYFTGSKAHNIALRRRAQLRGLKISEYGVFHGSRRVAGKTEEDVYGAVGLPWIPPELRENRGEIELAECGCLPELVELQQVRGDFHSHTSATDGRNTLAEMVEGARRRGYSYLAITDHSKRVTMARGLDARRLRQQWREIDKLRSSFSGIHILKGIELDILESGQLDLPDDVLAEADWVVASIHYGQKQSPEKITQRLLGAIRHPSVCAIAHPTGRLIGERPGYEFDFDRVLREAAKYGCLMEINGQPARLDLSDTAALQAHQLGVGIVLGSDAHSVDELCFLQGSINQARRAGLAAADVLNTLTWPRLQKRLQTRRHRRCPESTSAHSAPPR